MISVIINSYYRLDFLGQAADSVCSQIGDLDYEVILLTPFDQCPLTPEMDRRFAHAGVSFRELPLGPGTVGQYLSAGATAARGEFLALLDDDDTWAPDKLQQVSSRFAAQPAATFLHNGCDLVDSTGRGLPPWSRHRLVRHRSTLRNRPKEVVFLPSEGRSISRLMRLEPTFNNSSIAIRRDVLLAHQDALVTITGGEDAFLFFSALAARRPLLACADTLTLVRIHPTGATAATETLAERNLHRNRACQTFKEFGEDRFLAEMLLKEEAFWELVRNASVGASAQTDIAGWIRTLFGTESSPPTLLEILAAALGLTEWASPGLASRVWGAWRRGW